jgi:hypothetical protein
MAAWIPLAALLLCLVPAATDANSTATWLTKRDQLIGSVYGNGDGVLPTQSQPDWTLDYPSEQKRYPGLRGLVWDLKGKFFPINATTFYSPITPGKQAKSAFLFHHGHSNCVCRRGSNEPPIAAAQCRPGCISSMPSLAEIGDPGYSFWDLYNTSGFLHSLGFDVFILSMPLYGVNLGPGSNTTHLEGDHNWMWQWEQQGDSPLRYFLQPAYLTVNYAKTAGYEQVFMAGLSGGGWTTTFAAAIDKRIDASFPIAGSLPCDMRNPESWDHPQSWTGDSDEDYEQSCRPNSTDPSPDHTGPGCQPTKEDPHPPCPDARPGERPTLCERLTYLCGVSPCAVSRLAGRPAFQFCNYTCQYLLAGLEPGRFQTQILHEYDDCCFSPHNRHAKVKAYERNIRAELMADSRAEAEGHGWFTASKCTS